MDKRHDKEFKINAVKLALMNGIKNTSDELELSYSTLRSWISKFGDSVKKELPKNSRSRRGRKSKYEKEISLAADNAETDKNETYTDTEEEPIEETAEEAEETVQPAEEETSFTEESAESDVSSEENAEPDESDELQEESDVTDESAEESAVPAGAADTNKEGGLRFDNYFFVDFENVKRSGLEGMEQLGSNDCVRIYYGLSDRLPFELHKKMLMSDADFEYVEIELPIKNALDCRLLFDIEDFSKFDIAENYYIVSNDTDYDNTVKLFSGKGLNICKISKISEYVKQGFLIEKEIVDVISPIPENVLSFGEKRILMELIRRSTGKNNLNRKLTRFFYGQQLKTIWKFIKPLTDKLPSDN